MYGIGGQRDVWGNLQSSPSKQKSQREDRMPGIISNKRIRVISNV